MWPPKTEPDPDRGGGDSGTRPPKTKIGYGGTDDEQPEQHAELLRPSRTYNEFESQSIRAIVWAHDEAIVLRHGYIGTEHLVLGLVMADSLKDLWLTHQVTLEEAREQLVNLVGRGLSTASIDEELPYSTWLKLAINVAKDYAQATYHAAPQKRLTVRPYHLLVGIVTSGGEGITILRRTGIDAKEVEQFLVREKQRLISS